MPYLVPYLPYNKRVHLTMAQPGLTHTARTLALHEAIVTALQSTGPATCRSLAARLDVERRSMAWCLKNLAEDGLVHACGTTRPAAGGGALTVWKAGPGVPRCPAADAAKKWMAPQTGIDQNDLAWMAYWRQPRSIRRRRALEDAA
ncbi:MAG: helix-turn-helix domain-containing protein [Chromatiaceae bacterium]|nr:helix-turn-helix domain-containing protein [Candidatus Thioaporhodococcus sediminis]